MAAKERHDSLVDLIAPLPSLQARHSDARHVRTGDAQGGRKRQKRDYVLLQTDFALAIAVISAVDGETAMLVIIALETA